MSNVVKLSNGNELEVRDFSVDIGSKSAFMRFEKSYNEVELFLGTNIITSIDLIVDGEATEHYSTYLEPQNITVADENIMDSSKNEDGEIVVKERVAKIVTVYLKSPNVDKQLEDIKDAVGIVNPDTLSLDEYKKYRITQSKEQLEEYLTNNPLKSSVHGSEETYSITQSKQLLLLLEINMKTIGGDVYTSSWNASGKTCEPWTLEQLTKLAGEMAAIVKPLVSYQQSLEEQIMSKTSITDVKSVLFNFTANDPRNKQK